MRSDAAILQAALTSGETATTAYAYWRDQLDWETIPARWQRLLPLLHQNLTKLGIEDVLLERMKGVRRYKWAKNLRLIALAKSVIAELSRAGIDTLTLKGTSLVASGYVDRSIRPMDDIDLLIRPEQMQEAVRILKPMGIEPRFIRPASHIGRVVSENDYCGWPFSNSTDEIDLHWSAMHLDRRADSDQLAWANSRIVTFEGHDIRVLDPADQLLNICAHGARDADTASMRWIADAVLVIQRAGPIDWQVVVERAAYHRLSSVMARALDLIDALFELPIDRRAVEQLHRQSTWPERMEIRAWGRPADQWKRGIYGRFLAVRDHARGRSELFQAPFITSASSLLMKSTGASGVAAALLRLAYFRLGMPPALRKFLASDRSLLTRPAESIPFAGNLDLTTQDCPESMFVRGWSIAEAAGRWTDGPSATLLLQLEKPTTAMPVFRFQLLPATAEYRSAFTLSIYLNDNRVAKQRFVHGDGGSREITCFGPVCPEPTALVSVTFEMRGLKHPQASNPDQRRLGILLSRIELVDTTMPAGLPAAALINRIPTPAPAPPYWDDLEGEDMTEVHRALLERIRALEGRIAQLEDGQKSLQSAYSRTRASLRRLWVRPPMWTFEQHLPHALDLAALPAPPPVALDTAPSIGIVTPSYNQARFLPATLKSVLDQNYPKLKFHVQDGNSIDDSSNILETYGNRLSWNSAPDSGQSDAINRGFATIDGDIMAYLNSDDTLLPGTLAYVADFFRKRPDIDVVYGHRIFIDSDGLEIGRAVLPAHSNKALLYAGYIPQETMFWRRRVWDSVGGMDTNLHYALDWDFMLRAQQAGFKFARAPRFLACFRVHDRQKTTRTYDVGRREMGELRRKYLGYSPNTGDIYRALMPYLIRQLACHWAYKLNLLKTDG